MNLHLAGHRRALVEAEARLDDGLRGGFLTCPLVAVIGAKGGGGKTTTAAALLHLLGQHDRVAGMLLGIDANPDVGDLVERVGITASRVPERLVDFAAAPDAVRHPVDWAPLLDITGRIHVLHNEGVASTRIEALLADQWRAALSRARRFSSMLVVDTGTALRHPSSIATIDEATSLVIATRADPLAIDKTAHAVAELVQDGHNDLVSRATVVLTAVDKGVKPEAYAEGMAFLASRVAAVTVVPYDKAAGAVGPIGFAAAAPATRLAWMSVLDSVVGDLRARQGAPASLTDQADSGRIDTRITWPIRELISETDAGAADLVASDLTEAEVATGDWVPDWLRLPGT